MTTNTSHDPLNPQPYGLHTHDRAAVATHQATHYTMPAGQQTPRVVISDFDGEHVQTAQVHDDEIPDAALARAGWQRVGSWDTTQERQGREYCRVRPIPDGVLEAWRRHVATVPTT